MATLKAAGEITIYRISDISSVCRYYLLQSSTASVPSKPTTKPPGGSWKTIEPSYAAGSSNILYFVDLTIFNDDTFSYSDVSKSSSYEAAKAAYEKANSVNDKLDVIKNTGTGGNLVRNGYGELLDNTNFRSGVFTRGDCPDGCYGYFTNGITERIPFNPNLTYEYEYYVRLHAGKSGSNYFSIVPYDVDDKLISENNVLGYNLNLFYLDKDLKDGDTIVYFKDLSKWRTTYQTYQRSFMIFGYADSTGYTYPDGTYTRYYYNNVYSSDSSVDKTNNTITLTSKWSNGTVKAGTCIGQGSLDSTYCYYGQTGVISNTEWKKFSGTIHSYDGKTYDTISARRLLYAKSIEVNLYNDIADYAKLYIGEKVVDKDAIVSIDVEYYLSTSPVSLSGGSWSTTAPIWVDGKYLWSRTVKIDGAGDLTYSPSQNGVCIAGATGAAGATGRGISTIVEQYYKSNSSTSLSGGSWKTTYPGWENDTYIWTRSVITYTDNSTTTTDPICVTGSQGATGPTGKGVKSSTVTYQSSTSGTTIPTGTWITTIPSVNAGSFLWTKTVITYTDNTISTSYSVGKMGNTGAAGKGIKSTAITYQSWNSQTSTPTGTWITTIPTLSTTNPYLWTKTVITYTDNTTSTSYSISSTLNSVDVGGRNLILNSDVWTLNGSAASGITQEVTDGVLKIVSTSGNGNWKSFERSNVIEDNLNEGDTFTFAIEIKSEDGTKPPSIYFKNGMGYYGMKGTVSSEYSWVYYTGTWKKTNSISFNFGWSSSIGTYYIRKVKLEKGNIATDWTPAPEDMATAESTSILDEAMNALSDKINERVEQVEFLVDDIQKMISTLVVDSNGGSLMQQTSDGWVFSMGEIISKIQQAYNDIDSLENESDTNSGNIKALQKAMEGIETLTSYVRITTDGDEPCIELGNGGSFKVLITNTDIKFMDGTSVPAYITNQSLKIGKAEIEDELIFGGFVFSERSNGNMGLMWKGDE